MRKKLDLTRTADIPKLEQLLLSRIRSLIQDRFVHPKTFSVSLPQLLSSGSNLSSKEFMSDLGEEAKEVMSQAVRQGLGQIVTDLGLGGDETSTSDGQLGTGMPGTRATSINGQSALPTPSGLYSSSLPNGSSNNGPLSPRTAGRKIHMPAGFPSSASTSTYPTPLQTPGPSSSRREPISAGIASAYQTPGPSMTTAYRNPMAEATRRNAPSAGGNSNGGDAFRFRGQFAGPGPGSGTSGGGEMDRRRVGALNSRAG